MSDHFGQAFKVRRKAMGLSQEQLAGLAKVSQSAVSRLELASILSDAGRQDTVAMVAAALGLSDYAEEALRRETEARGASVPRSPHEATLFRIAGSEGFGPDDYDAARSVLRAADRYIAADCDPELLCRRLLGAARAIRGGGTVPTDLGIVARALSEALAAKGVDAAARGETR